MSLSEIIPFGAELAEDERQEALRRDRIRVTRQYLQAAKVRVERYSLSKFWDDEEVQGDLLPEAMADVTQLENQLTALSR